MANDDYIRDEFASGRPQAIQFRLEEADWAQYSIDLMKHVNPQSSSAADRAPLKYSQLTKMLSPAFSNPINLTLYGLALAFVIFISVLFVWPDTATNPWFLVSLVLACHLLMLWLISMISHAILTPSLYGFTFSEKSYSFEEEGLLIKQDFVEQAFMWQSISQLIETEQAFYLMVDQNISHIFPKNAFVDQAECDTFAAFVQERIRFSRLDI